MQFGQDSTSPTTRISKRNTGQLKGYGVRFPPQIQQFVHSIVNVESDGHCGFCMIAGLLGMSEHNWRDIRYNLIGELQYFCVQYMQLYKSDTRADKLLHILYFFDDITPYKHWMTLPDIGHLIASKYNVILVHLSRIQCLTYLPLRSIHPLAVQQRMITIGFVNNYHFV